MHVEQAERLPALHDEVADLFRVVSRFRWRLAVERLLASALRGLIGSAAAAVVLSLLVWLLAGTQTPVSNQAWWLVALPPLVALGLALARWPSRRQAALAADRRLVLGERLGTAIEIAERARGNRGSGRFDRLQLRDAVEQATGAPGAWLVLDRRVRREALLAALLVAVAAAALVVLPEVPRPSVPSADDGRSQADGAALPGAVAAAAQPDALATVGPAQVQPPPQSLVAPDPGLAAKVQQEQAEQDALDSLSQALGSVSATQPAADAMQQGDYSTARQQLSSLGDEADQLSAAAKQQLSQALQAAASTSSADRQLADRERQAAQALNRGTYADQRQALQALGDQVERSGQRSASADQLAREQGQLQQQQAAGGQANGQSTSTSAAVSASATSRQAPADPAGGAPTAGSQGSAGGQGGGQQGQPGGPGAGTGADPQPLGDSPSRLESSGQTVTVPTKLGSGPGVRPPDGSEDQSASNPATGGQTVSELVQSQQTGEVAPEQNLVPGEQRPVVRGYFR